MIDLFDLPDLPVVVLHPPRIIDPDPPDWRFGGLPLEYAGLARTLPAIGIHSLDELAAAEPEDVFHRSLQRREKRGGEQALPVHSRLFGKAVNAAFAGRGGVHASCAPAPTLPRRRSRRISSTFPC